MELLPRVVRLHALCSDDARVPILLFAKHAPTPDEAPEVSAKLPAKRFRAHPHEATTASSSWRWPHRCLKSLMTRVILNIGGLLQAAELATISCSKRAGSGYKEASVELLKTRIDYLEEIGRLKGELNAVILAHYYQEPEIQDLADFIGDSLGLARQAQGTDAEVMAHPECEERVLRVADHIGSTSSLLKRAVDSPARKFIVATEPGIIHQMRKAAPETEFM